MDEVILEDMKSFDFNMPLNETIIYDDSDDNDETFTIKCESEEINDINSNTNITFENKDVDDKSGSKENKAINRKRCNSQLYEKESRSTKKISDQPNNNKTETIRKDKDEIERNERKKAKNVKENLNKKSRCNDNASNSTVSTQKVDDSIVEKDDSKNNTDKIQINKENFEELTDYIKDILNTLSHNLILSVEAYYSHLKRLGNMKADQNNIKAVQDSKKRFLNLKYYYFHLSYIAVVGIILPHEKKNNAKFAEEFFNKTVNYAKDKMNLNITKQDLQPMYYELISWAKTKQDCLNSARNMPPINQGEEVKDRQSESNKTPTLLEAVKDRQNEANKTPMLLEAVIDRQNEANKTPTLLEALGQPSAFFGNTHSPTQIPLFSAGAPDREVTISVDTAALRGFRNVAKCNQSKQLNQSYPQDRYYSPVPSLPLISSATNTNTREKRMLPPSTLHEVVPSTNVYNNNYNYSVMLNREYSDQRFRRSNIIQPQTLPPPPPYYSNNINLNNTNTYIQEINSADYGLNNNQALTFLPQQQPVQTEMQLVESSRSSVSTDSGLASPLHFNTGAEGMVPQTDERQLVPLITHVTSLNPNAQYIPEGFCRVCCTTTKTKCIGCYQMYYCSSICQAVDWDMHKNLCRKVQEVRNR